MQVGWKLWKGHGKDATVASLDSLPAIMRAIEKNWLILFPVATLTCFFCAIATGIASTWLQSFGYLPAIGYRNFSLQPWLDLTGHPGFAKAFLSTLISGWGATCTTLGITTVLLSFHYKRRFWRLLERSLAPLLAVPHAAFAIGLLFLTAPSGWIFRLLSPEVTGYFQPPIFSIVQDTCGISLMAALVLKETPFLVLMSLSALSRIDRKGSLAVGRSLGYDTSQIWMKIILPQLYPKIRLSLFAMLAYSLSVVDIAQILGPTTPPTLAVQVFRWFHDPDMGFRPVAAAGATCIFLIVAASIGGMVLLEAIAKRVFRFWMTNGRRHSSFSWLRPLGNWLIVAIVFFSFASIAVLVIWSFAWRWRFPDNLPAEWSMRFWTKGSEQLQEPVWNTVRTGFMASLAALLLVIGCLENERSRISRGFRIGFGKVLWLLYIPLLIPQIAFLFGVQTILVVLHLDALWISLVWSHLLFVFPYVFLTLGPVYRAYDQRMADIATILSGSPRKAFLKVKLPIMLRPIAFSLAVGFSVSVAQYLPTLFIGAGRYPTVTTEAVTLASGSDRRMAAVFALCQMTMPLAVFIGAITIPKICHRRRMGMRI